MTGGFNPRTHKGCDLSDISISPFPRSFNPRTHKGCDFEKSFSDRFFLVSIHAPTKGATLYRIICLSFMVFQSTHPQRVRQSTCEAYGRRMVFQSTHPQRVRLVKYNLLKLRILCNTFCESNNYISNFKNKTTKRLCNTLILNICEIP